MANIYLPELAVMQDIAGLVSSLTQAEKKRVAVWLSEYVQQDSEVLTRSTVDASAIIDANQTDVWVDDAADAFPSDEAVAEDADDATAFESFDALYAKVAPAKGAQKAATAAWWLEDMGGQQSWTAFEVNKLLKSIDVKVSSISIVLTNAVKADGALVEELGRSGDGTRSRKAFRLTEAGREYVQARLA